MSGPTHKNCPGRLPVAREFVKLVTSRSLTGLVVANGPGKPLLRPISIGQNSRLICVWPMIKVGHSML